MFFRKLLLNEDAARELEAYALALESQEPFDLEGVACFVTEMLTEPGRGTWVYLEHAGTVGTR